MTAAPQRNFDLPLDERIRSLMAGPPAFSRRLRAIEDLEEAIVVSFIQEAAGEVVEGMDPPRLRAAAHRKLVALVAHHNRYYPIEANLPMCLQTRVLLDRDGTPWRPRSCPSLQDLERRGSLSMKRTA
jgi:hypothetical protein